MWWFLLFCLLDASAEIPPPSYKAAVSRRAWHEVNQVLEHASRLAADEASMTPYGQPAKLSPSTTVKYMEAIHLAERFEQQVVETSGLAYLIGLTWREMGHLENAEFHYRRSLKLDESGADAWYDLGEIFLAQSRFQEARDCFEHVSLLVTTGPNAWRGSIRLAEIAGHQKDAIRFEANIKEALRHGFSLHQIRGQPQWKTFYQDEVLRDSVQKLVKVYGDPSILKSLEP